MSEIVKLPAGATPPSNDNADFPGCVRWYRMMEDVKGNGTVLADKMGNDTTLAVVQNGTGNADATAQGLTLSNSTGNEVYAAGGSLITVGANSLIIEMDDNLDTTGDNGGSLIENGNPYSNNDGWHVAFVNSTGSLQFICRNAAKTGSVSTTLNNSPDVSTGGRRHKCIVWDRSVADPGAISYYVDGVLQGTFALSGAVGTGLDPDGSDLTIGFRTSSGLTPNGVVYNRRVWSLSAIPSNIGLVVAQMAANPDEFPQLLKGVS